MSHTQTARYTIAFTSRKAETTGSASTKEETERIDWKEEIAARVTEVYVHDMCRHMQILRHRSGQPERVGTCLAMFENEPGGSRGGTSRQKR